MGLPLAIGVLLVLVGMLCVDVVAGIAACCRRSHAPFATLADPTQSPLGAGYVKGLMRRVLIRRWVAFPFSRVVAVSLCRVFGPILLRLDHLDTAKMEYRANARGVRKYLMDSQMWPTVQIENELIGFPNYQGPTELARLMFVITGTEWTDTILCGGWMGFKALQAGTPLMPTGSGPMFVDSTLGEHRLSEYLAVFPYIASKLALMGEDPQQEAQIYFLATYIGGSLSGLAGGLASDFVYRTCLSPEAAGISPEDGPFANNMKNFILGTEQEKILTEEGVKKLQAWLRTWVDSHAKLQHINDFLRGSQFLFGDKVSYADVSLMLEMLRIYGRRIVREAVPDFAQRFPHAVRHLHMMLREFPQLVSYLQDPNRHYKPAYVYLNQCEAISSYGDLFERSSDAVAPSVCELGDKATESNPISAALATLMAALREGPRLSRVVARGEWLSSLPWLASLLRMLGISISSEAEDGVLDLDTLCGTMDNPQDAVKFVIRLLAGAKCALGADMVAKAKNMQVLSMVIYLFKAYADQDKAFFKREVLDPARSGAQYSNVSPGNAQYLEALVEINERDPQGGVVGTSRLDPTTLTLAEMSLAVFTRTILEDKELFLDEGDLHRFRERFPGLMRVHGYVGGRI
jgi:glutathione S-transferase